MIKVKPADRVRTVQLAFAKNEKQFFSVTEVCHLLFPTNCFPVNKAAAVRRWLEQNQRQDNRAHIIGNRAYRNHYRAIYNRNPPRAVAVSKGTILKMMSDERFITKHQD